MAAITASDLDAAYKVLYKGQQMESLVADERARPFLTRVKKDPNLEGDYFPLPVMYEDVGGGSLTFSKSQENQAAPAMAQFAIDASAYYRTVQITTKALRKAKSNLGAFISKQKIRTDSALNALANDLEKALFRSADAHLAQISSSGFTSGTPNYLVLSNLSDVKLFAIGDQIVAAAALTNAPHAAVGTITAIAYDTGTLTVSGTLTSWANSHYIWREGDHVGASDTLGLHGLNDWIPATLEASTFMGVTRSANRDLLAGFYYSGGSLADIEYSLFYALCQMGDRIAAPVDVILVDYTLWGLLCKEMGIEVKRDPRDGKLGFASVAIAHPNGVAEVLPCKYCQPSTAWLMTMEDWTLFSLGDVVGVFDDDGSTMMRISDTDGIEVRCVSYPELGCSRPARSGRVAFS